MGVVFKFNSREKYFNHIYTNSCNKRLFSDSSSQHTWGGFGNIKNAYYKDVDNFFDQFIGTWVYTDANKTIRMRFRKREMVYTNYTNVYADYLVGETQYIENGVEKLNSLNNLAINHVDIDKYNIVGFTKVGYSYNPICTECPQNIERIIMFYDEATNDDFGLEWRMLMGRVTENGIQKIKIQFDFQSGPGGMNKNGYFQNSTTQNFTVPYGNYTLTKEN